MKHTWHTAIALGRLGAPSAFFSGISTGSLHGWVWFAAAFAGAFVGIRIRPMVGLEARA